MRDKSLESLVHHILLIYSTLTVNCDEKLGRNEFGHVNIGKTQSWTVMLLINKYLYSRSEYSWKNGKYTQQQIVL